MVRVITERKWKEWCHDKGLMIDSAIFALETCYYGSGLRSRPGALLLTRSELIHHSYSWRDTLWAVGEPSIRVTIPLAAISRVTARAMGLFLRVYQLGPDSMFRIIERSGKGHDLLLQRKGAEFSAELAALGVQCADDRPAD